MKYQNPILLCDYSDPDVIRVGKNFYMTASSFNFVPGLPLLKSQNLVDWTLVNYAVKKIELPNYDQVQNAKGIWAPSLRFHNGLFYIFFATPDEGIFETHARTFEGEWSQWNCVWAGKGFIDPCPIWLDDENDGNEKIYVVHGYAKSRIGFNSKLGILELDENLKAKDCRLVSTSSTGTDNRFPEDKIIFDGTKTQPTIEGPKIYKRGEYFYIFAPSGGVTFGWQTVLRSKNIFGPYEEKIVLAQGKSKINGPHQGGYVEAESGEGFFLHFQDAGIYGRITHLQPVKWKNGWPLMGSAAVKNKVETGEPLESYFVPFDEDSDSKNKNGGFEVAENVSEFQFSGNAGVEEEDKNDAFDKLNQHDGDGTLWLNSNVCTKKITSKKFEYEKKILISDFDVKNENRHGIIFLGNEYSALQVEKRTDGFYLSQIVSSGSEAGDEVRQENLVFEEKISKNVKSVLLKLNFEEDEQNARFGIITFSCKTNGETEEIEFISNPFITENAHWVGGRVGFF